jgi:hypothetical protein
MVLESPRSLQSNDTVGPHGVVSSRTSNNKSPSAVQLSELPSLKSSALIITTPPPQPGR